MSACFTSGYSSPLSTSCANTGSLSARAAAAVVLSDMLTSFVVRPCPCCPRSVPRPEAVVCDAWYARRVLLPPHVDTAPSFGVTRRPWHEPVLIRILKNTLRVGSGEGRRHRGASRSKLPSCAARRHYHQRDGAGDDPCTRARRHARSAAMAAVTALRGGPPASGVSPPPP